MRFPRLALLCILITPAFAAPTVPLGPVVSTRDADFDLARPLVDKTAAGQPMAIAGRTYAKGLGTQVDCRFAIELKGAVRFTGAVGVDDATESAQAVRVELQLDGRTVWTKELKRGDAAVPIDLDTRGAKQLVVIGRDLGNNATHALVDWVDAQFEVEGEKPGSALVPAIAEPAVILTPKPSAAPRINGPRVVGVRPGHPFLHQIPATGERPLTFSAEGLPAGLTLDAQTGRITGVLPAAGTHRVTLHAKNARGADAQALRIEVGETIALTPAMGWNSWNCWGVSVDQEKVLASARAIVASGLVNHGWSYINIDDTWQGARTGPDRALQANEKFPDMKKFCDEVHAMGLKAGIYSTPWITSYAGYAGGSADNPAGDWVKPPAKRQPNRKVKPWHLGDYSFAVADAKQWAAWGIDYLKYDWNPNEVPETKAMADALRASGRDIVYSLSNNSPFESAADLSALANSWRTTGDIRDTWGHLHGIWVQQEKWREFARPGHWNDPDMLVIGPVDVGSGKSIRPSRLTPNEQYTHITLWSLWSAPLLIGCPVEKADEFTLSLLSNDEVLAINQDELGRQAKQQVVDGRKQVYVKELADGSRAIGFFNLAQEAQTIAVTWAQLGLTKPARIRDLWRQQDVPVAGEGFSVEVGRHGTHLIRVWPSAPATAQDFTPTPRGRELLTASLAFCEKNWDDRAAMVMSPGGVDPSPEEPRQHRVRETVWYALGLVLRNEPGDLGRAGRAIDAVLAQQFDTPGQRWDGTFRRGLEEADPPAKGAKMWDHYDPNWREFVGTTLALILIRGGDRLPADLTQRMERAITRAVEGELADTRLKPGYTNIALMHGFLWSWAGQRLGKPEWVTRGEAWCQAVHQLWAVNRAFDEYNSPTYYGVDLYGLALWREFGPTEKIRTLGAEMEAGLWRDIGDYYHAGLKNLCGPFDRSYGMDMRRYVALTGVWIGLVVPADQTPLPDPAKPMAHGHDFFCVPTYVALNLQVPPEAAASFRKFQGTRQLTRPISGSRVATAWIGETLMFGGESTGNTRGANKATSQFHPATMHWRAPGDDVGWMRLFASPNCDATAAAGLLTVSSAAPGEFTYRLAVAGLKPEMLAKDHWTMPGLGVRVETDAKEFQAKAGNDYVDVTYRGATRFALRLREPR